MRRTKQKRALALLLSLAAALSLTVLPGHASRFQDVPDQRVSLAADTLSALGVVSGTGAGKFSPNGYLTRAQLCKMAVEIMGMGEQAQAQAYRTIFTDMKNHWARGYVNLAATTEVSEGTRLMLGLGNGTFGPDRNVTYQEAVTVVLRILGYGAQANRAWPHSAVETAAQLGLDQDLKIGNPAAPITRGQTALLFYHMLFTSPKGEEGPYAVKMGTPVEDAILLAADATVNGQSGWVVMAHGDSTKTYPAAAPADTALLGKRGTALLDREGRFVTLIPDDSTSSVTAPVERKEGYYLYLSGKRYALSADTPVYTGSTYSAGVTTYGEYMANLRTGTVVTLYLDSQGKAIGLYRGESSAETRFVVAGSRGGSYEAFRSLTGSEQNYTVRKNGVSVPMSAVKQYDVATYDPVAKVLNVCDVRLTCVYENAAPSAGSPSRITAAGGNSFDVLADAIGSFSGYKLGDKLTLMFTYDGKVAGVLPKNEHGVACLALGVLEDGGFRLLGCDLTLTGGVADGAHQGGILNAGSERRDTLVLTPAGTQTSAKFNTENMTLGNMRVDPGVRIYERTANGLLARGLTELPASVTAAQYHKDGSGMVDLIIVNGYSGEGYKYGRIDTLSGYELVKLSSGAPGPDGIMTKDKWTVRAVQGQPMFTDKDGSRSISTPGNGYYSSGYVAWSESLPSIVYLQAIKNVSSSAFYTQDGVTYVRTSKGVYPVDEDVPCFNGAASSYTQSDTPPDWVRLILNSGGIYTGDLGVEAGTVWSPTGNANVVMFRSLGECRSFSDTVTVYIDSASQRVRVVEAGA